MNVVNSTAPVVDDPEPMITPLSPSDILLNTDENIRDFVRCIIAFTNSSVYMLNLGLTKCRLSCFEKKILAFVPLTHPAAPHIEKATDFSTLMPGCVADLDTERGVNIVVSYDLTLAGNRNTKQYANLFKECRSTVQQVNDNLNKSVMANGDALDFAIWVRRTMIDYELFGATQRGIFKITGWDDNGPVWKVS